MSVDVRIWEMSHFVWSSRPTFLSCKFYVLSFHHTHTRFFLLLLCAFWRKCNKVEFSKLSFHHYDTSICQARQHFNVTHALYSLLHIGLYIQFEAMISTININYYITTWKKVRQNGLSIPTHMMSGSVFNGFIKRSAKIM
jgi:hypothetical protein